jgi:hypothetical protein
MTTEGRLEARRSKSPRGLKTLKIFTRRDNPGRDEGARDRKEVNGSSEFRGERAASCARLDLQDH